MGVATASTVVTSDQDSTVWQALVTSLSMSDAARLLVRDPHAC